LRQTGRTEEKINITKQYLSALGLFKDYENDADLQYSSLLELDLSTVQPCVSGPKRPHDYVALNELKKDWNSSLTNPIGFKGFGLNESNLEESTKFTFNGEEFELKHGSVVIAAITSCTNTSNPGVMLAAALLCKNASERGIKIRPYIKTSLSPGSQAVSRYY
jgi:aconitate hydratase